LPEDGFNGYLNREAEVEREMLSLDPHEIVYAATLRKRFLAERERVRASAARYVKKGTDTVDWWLHQNDLPSVVATMGADCSEKQAELILPLVKPNGRVWIAPDGNKAGERHAQMLLSLISPHRFVRWVKMGDEKQPTDLSLKQLKICFTV
jgi:hypothetical protein